MYDSQHVQNVAAAIVAVVYGLAGIALLLYTDRVKKQLDRHEEEEKLRRQRHYEKCNESTHKSDPTQPLLGVVYPQSGKKGE